MSKNDSIFNEIKTWIYRTQEGPTAALIFLDLASDKTSSESPPSINDGFCSCYVGRLQKELFFFFWLFLNLKALITCVETLIKIQAVCLKIISWKRRGYNGRILTSSEAKYTHRCATSSAVHILPVFCLAIKSLKAWEVKDRNSMTERLTDWTVCLYD